MLAPALVCVLALSAEAKQGDSRAVIPARASQKQMVVYPDSDDDGIWLNTFGEGWLPDGPFGLFLLPVVFWLGYLSKSMAARVKGIFYSVHREVQTLPDVADIAWVRQDSAVFITKTGGCYHKFTCNTISKKLIKMLPTGPGALPHGPCKKCDTCKPSAAQPEP
jgi:hypothetical protein